MKKREISCGIAALCLILFTGCGATLPPMTDAQQDAIAEYAAALVMRHTRDYSSRLVDLSLYEEKEPEKIDEPESGGMDATADTPVIDNSDDNNIDEPVYQSIDALLVPDGVVITYMGSQILDSYPENEDDDLFFALDASTGKKLLVLRFSLQNTTGEEKNLDIFSVAPRFVVKINDTERTHVISTMLLDDLSTYIGSLAAGEEISLVLLAEIDNTLDTIEKLELTVSTSEESAVTLLQ
ncbi:MAG: hypothetical protein HDQ99_19565 [Lachnospiraceae bacterium]|nr:hypothetical protein [Lachnospiraceae bacterium]